LAGSVLLALTSTATEGRMSFTQSVSSFTCYVLSYVAGNPLPTCSAAVNSFTPGENPTQIAVNTTSGDLAVQWTARVDVFSYSVKCVVIDTSYASTACSDSRDEPHVYSSSWRMFPATTAVVPVVATRTQPYMCWVRSMNNINSADTSCSTTSFTYSSAGER
jgi:hypothetical protein